MQLVNSGRNLNKYLHLIMQSSLDDGDIIKFSKEKKQPAKYQIKGRIQIETCLSLNSFILNAMQFKLKKFCTVFGIHMSLMTARYEKCEKKHALLA